MPKLSPAFTATIKELSDKEKEKIILRFARANPEMYDKLEFELVEDVTLETIQEKAQDTISELLFAIMGRSFYKALNKAIGKAVKEITRVKKVTKSAQLEADLYLYLLAILFNNYGGQFENANRSFPGKVARITQKLYGLIVKNLHPDLRIEYKTEIDNWLEILRNRAGSNIYVQKLPKELPEAD